MGNGYDVIHDSRYDREAEAVFGSCPLADELARNIIWLISRDPKQGDIIANNVWYFKNTNDKLFDGRIFVFYTFREDTKELRLLSIKKF